MSRHWLMMFCFALGTVFSGSLFAQERTAAVKDELREQYKPAGQTNVPALPPARVVPSSPLDTDVLVNNNNGAQSDRSFTQSEASLVAYGNNVVIGFNDAGSYTGSNNHFTGWSYSTDGGATFIDGGSFPNSTIGDAGDPVVARNATTGRIYLSTLGFTSPSTIQIWRSDDNGASWMAPTNGTPGGSSEDKQWHTVDNFPGTGNGNVYVISRRFGTGPGIYVFRSTDHGDTFTPSGGVQMVTNQQGAFIAVGPDHSVYAFWYNGTTLQMRKSTDFGVTFAPAVTVFTGLVGGTNGNLGLTGIRQGTTTPSSFRSNEFPHVVIHPVTGYLYVTFNNIGTAGGDKADIFMVQSTDGGATWGTAVKINDDVTTTDQWQPTIAITPTGSKLGIFYYSREEDQAGNNLFKFYGRIGTIAGTNVTWEPSFAISDVPSLPEFGRDAVVNSVYMGDYTHAVATPTAFHVIWSDNRDDLPGGAPRKDPNMYYEKIPVTDDFGWVAGTITNVNGGAPIQGATVDFVEPVIQAGSQSLANGYYLAGARVDTPGTTINLTLRATKFGFLDTLLAVTLTRNDTLTRNFGMQPLDFVVMRSSITFPPTPVPGLTRDSVIARNQGTIPITLSSLTTTNPDFAVSPTSGTIPVGDSVKIYITYTPNVEGSDTGRVIIMSSSVYTPRKDIVLTGTAIGVPVFTTNVDSLTRTLEGGVRDSVSFRIRNTGTTSGTFSARALMFPRTAANRGNVQPIVIPMSVEAVHAGRAVTAVSHPEDALASSPAAIVQPPAAAFLRRLGAHDANSGPSATLQQSPELLYYKFNEIGGTTTVNFAIPGVGTNPAPVTGLTMGGVGQFGSALVGNGGASGSNNVNPGWSANTGGGAWTISVWLTNLPVNTTLYYLFGDAGASTFRCFIGGVAGSGGIALRGGGGPDLYIANAAPGPTVVTYTYDPGLASNQLKAYFNGVMVTEVSATYSINGTGFLVGGYSTLVGLPAGGRMDEFRFYNRALSAGEVAATWNTELGGGAWFSVAPTEGTVAIGDSILMKAYFDATDSAIFNDPGEYLGQLDVVATNSALADTLRIPSRMFVVPPPGARISLNADSLDFGDVEIDSSRTLSVLVRNIGASTLTVTGTTISNPNFSSSPTSFTVPSLGTQNVNVTFTAPSPGATHTGTLQFVSNDPLAPSLPLRGRSVGIGHVVVLPDSFFFAISQGDSVNGAIRIRNTGLGELTYTSRVNGGYVGADSTTIGAGTSSGATSSGLMRGGVVQVTTSVLLNQIRSWLTITTSREMRWVVYENTTGTNYTKIFESATISGTGGPQWFLSGPINITLEAGKRYAIGVNWAAASGLTYFWQASAPVPIPIPYGTIVGGFAQTIFPPPATLTQGSLSSLYYTLLDVSTSQWLRSISGTSGTIASGDSATLGFRAYTSQLPGGIAQASLSVLSNDPLSPTVTVPVVVDVLTGVALDGEQIPRVFELYQNYPNPFNPVTQIRFGIPQESRVKLNVYNLLGQHVATIADGVQPAGYFVATWDGTNNSGVRVSSGIYFYRMESTSVDGKSRFADLKKMILLK